jgi:hypothetical protein
MRDAYVSGNSPHAWESSGRRVDRVGGLHQTVQIRSDLPDSAYHLIMMNTNQISERLARMRQEMNDVKIINARYWAKSQHTELDKAAHAFWQGQLLGIKQELSEMMKRCA